jgi:hypothetical protein
MVDKGLEISQVQRKIYRLIILFDSNNVGFVPL